MQSSSAFNIYEQAVALQTTRGDTIRSRGVHKLSEHIWGKFSATTELVFTKCWVCCTQFGDVV